MNKQSKSFLDKFKGKTNQISKQGLNQLLNKLPILVTSPNNLQEGNRCLKKHLLQNLQYEKAMDNVSQDNIIISQPIRNSENITSKSPINKFGKIRKNKFCYSPTVIQKQKLNLPELSENDPNRRQNAKYIYGKYLKLDQDALMHFEFLQHIEKKIASKLTKYVKFKTK